MAPPTDTVVGFMPAAAAAVASAVQPHRRQPSAYPAVRRVVRGTKENSFVGDWKNPWRLLCMCAKSLQLCLTLCNLWTVAHQAPLSIGFSRQEYQSGLPCPPPGDLLNPGIEPMSLMSPALASGFFTTSATWEALEVT